MACLAAVFSIRGEPDIPDMIQRLLEPTTHDYCSLSEKPIEARRIASNAPRVLPHSPGGPSRGSIPVTARAPCERAPSQLGNL